MCSPECYAESQRGDFELVPLFSTALAEKSILILCANFISLFVLSLTPSNLSTLYFYFDLSRQITFMLHDCR